MRFLLFITFSISAIYALTNDQVRQNCCTLYDGYPSGTTLSIGSRTDVYNQVYQSQMTEAQALSNSGYCDIKTHTVYAWEDPVQLEGLPDWSNPQYTKYAYSYTCSTCDKTQADFPTTYDNFPFQSIETDENSCLNKIQTYSKDSSGSAYQISTSCPDLIGCYYNLPDDTTQTDDSTNNDTTTDNSNNTSTNTTIPDSIAVNNLDTIENKLININSDTSRTANATESINDKFEIETNSDFATKLNENTNLFKDSLNTIQANYETVVSSFTDLKDFVTENPFTFQSISSSVQCNYDFTVFSKTISVNMCKYNYILAPLITFFLKIYFLYALIKLNVYLYLKAFVEGKTE